MQELKFNARYFNNVQGDDYIVTKSSLDKKKIKMEYTYYHLLPENMKKWMVKPYEYIEDEKSASYTMERIKTTDLSVKWICGDIGVNEFEKILDRAFCFFRSREKRKVEKNEYINYLNKLYIDKLDERIKKLKELEEFGTVEKLIENGTEYENIDEIVNLYKKKYNEVTKKIYTIDEYYSVIGHGDTCFSNMFFNEETNELKLIDPKGALEEKQLWTDPYYDVAKLSHSICGNYDFFNNEKYSIKLNKQMKLELEVNFDNTKYKEIFKEALKRNGYDYELVRIYEASLFLSMLPLHIDNIHKVFGFLLNGIDIIQGG